MSKRSEERRAKAELRLNRPPKRKPAGANQRVACVPEAGVSFNRRGSSSKAPALRPTECTVMVTGKGKFSIFL